MTSAEVREHFIDFFRSREHAVVPSAPVVPQDDPTLLFTNAGMNQFKRIFLGQEKARSSRVVDTQKCVRVSGKHNDLEEVGLSPYHHTFFEMLGNWSFGDYFKKEAIIWAWELMTGIYGFPKDKLYATVYETDDEAETLWRNETDINPDHVLRFGTKDNWWSMGETGPCGPCSEIHIDRGAEFDPDPKAFVNTDSPRFIELWNLVFIQFEAKDDGSLSDLPAKHIDTGAGLERLTAVLNHCPSNYDTDLFTPIIRSIEASTGKPYPSVENGIPHRVIADHLRCLTFGIADGIMPGNEGRGYVLRRLLRRAARFARKLEMQEPFIYKLVPLVVDMMGDVFPELKERHVHVSRVIRAEEEHFGKTLDRGLERFDAVVGKVRDDGGKIIPGDEAFRLYDTFGFPFDLMQLMAREVDLTVDETGFEKEMSRQRQRARSARTVAHDDTDSVLTGRADPTEFVGYSRLTAEVELLSVLPLENDGIVKFVTRQTPFYAESGGQVADVGTAELRSRSGAACRLNIQDVQIGGNGVFLHTGKLNSGEDCRRFSSEFTSDETAAADEAVGTAMLHVDPDHRIPTQCNHTATHLLQAALRKVLGSHVHQAGSLVHPEYLRFDYTHFEKPTAEELTEIEQIVNRRIRENYPVAPQVIPFEEAQKKGAMALFGEKYDNEVRMVEIGDGEKVVSRELCGGCHVKRTGDIGLFVIRSESSAAAGIRRIEALTGQRALDYLLEKRGKVDDFITELGSEGSDPLEKLRKTLEEKKKLQKELEKLRTQSAGSRMQSLASSAVQVGTAKLVAAEVTAESMDQLRDIGDALRNSLGRGVGVLAAVIQEKPALVVVVTDDLIKEGVDAVPIVKDLGKHLKGGGGGRPHLATAGGKDPKGLKSAIEDAGSVVEKYLTK